MILRIALAFVIIITSLCCKSIAQTPSVPCPDVFQYARNGDKNIGLITVKKVNYGQTEVEIEISQSGSINSDYAGNLNLNFDKDKIFDYIKSGSAVTYKVDFPLQNVIPQVSFIRVNGDTVCSGQKVGAPSVSVTLKHTLTAPGSSDTPQHTVPHKISFLPSKNLPWATPTKETFSSRPTFGYPNFLSSRLSLPSQSHTHDPKNPFFNGGKSFHFNFTLPSTTTTTQRPLFVANNPKNYPNFLQAVRPPFVTPPKTTPESFHFTFTLPTTSTTTTTTTTTSTTESPSRFDSNPFDTVIEAQHPVATNSISPESGPATRQYINSVCGRENFNFTVKKLAFHGDIIPRARFPWIVALFKKNVGTLSFQCGGSLISTRTVISAAHCFYSGYNKINYEDILVSMGRHNLTDWSDSYISHSDVHQIIQHPDYRPELLNIDADLAIVLLKNSVTFSIAIRPVCLWQGPVDVHDIEGAAGIVVGWGRDEKNNDLTTAPRLVTANIVSELTCIRSNEQLVYLTSNRTLCAGNRDGSGPCDGDSGSGLMIRNRNKWMLRGTVSAALGSALQQCNLEEYVVYTDIAKFMGWIYANMLL